MSEQYQHTEYDDINHWVANVKTNFQDFELLIQLCIGKVKAATNGTAMLADKEGCKKAKSILHEMLGQAHLQLLSCILIELRRVV